MGNIGVRAAYKHIRRWWHMGIPSPSTRFHRWLQRRWPALPPVFAVCAAVVIGILQIGISHRQANIAATQVELFAKQKAIVEDQHHMSTRPDIIAEVSSLSSDSPYRTGPWTIKNRGKYPVRNLQVSHIYFGKDPNHGWRVIHHAGSIEELTRPELVGGDVWPVRLDWLASTVRSIPYRGFTPQLEFIVLLLSFERQVDGRTYLYLEPFYISNGVPSSFDIFGMNKSFGMNSPLARVCAPGIELMYEYFKRQPFLRPYELYNYNYLLGYSPTGCLGPIVWLDNK
jgi:hypothetical protein